MAHSCLSKASSTVAEALPAGVRPGLSIIHEQTEQPQAAKLGFSSQTNSLALSKGFPPEDFFLY